MNNVTGFKENMSPEDIDRYIAERAERNARENEELAAACMQMHREITQFEETYLIPRTGYGLGQFQWSWQQMQADRDCREEAHRIVGYVCA